MSDPLELVGLAVVAAVVVALAGPGRRARRRSGACVGGMAGAGAHGGVARGAAMATGGHGFGRHGFGGPGDNDGGGGGD